MSTRENLRLIARAPLYCTTASQNSYHSVIEISCFIYNMQLIILNFIFQRLKKHSVYLIRTAMDR